MSRYWQAEAASSQLHDMNKHLFTELDQLQVSLLKVSQNGGDHSSSNPNLAALNPFLSHLSHLRSVYE